MYDLSYASIYSECEPNDEKDGPVGELPRCGIFGEDSIRRINFAI